MAVKTGYGATISVGGTTIGRVTRIGALTKTRDQVEVTDCSSPDQYTEFVNGMKDGGTVSVDFNYDPSDSGQLACDAAIEDGTTPEVIITFPSAQGTTLTFNANVQSFALGEITPKGIIPGNVEFRVTGKPVLANTASNQITELTVTTGTCFPTFAAGTHSYVVTTSDASVTFTATFAAGVCKLFVDGVETQALVSGVASGAVTATSAPRKVELKVTESGKTTRTYTFWLTKTA